MTTQVEATLTDGVLKPDQPLTLSDQTRVGLTIVPIGEWTPEKDGLPGRHLWRT